MWTEIVFYGFVERQLCPVCANIALFKPRVSKCVTYFGYRTTHGPSVQRGWPLDRQTIIQIGNLQNFILKRFVLKQGQPNIQKQFQKSPICHGLHLPEQLHSNCIRAGRQKKWVVLDTQYLRPHYSYNQGSPQGVVKYPHFFGITPAYTFGWG